MTTTPVWQHIWLCWRCCGEVWIYFFDLWKVFFLKERSDSNTQFAAMKCCFPVLMASYTLSTFSLRRNMYMNASRFRLWALRNFNEFSSFFTFFFVIFFRLITDKRGIILLLKKFLGIFVMFDYISFENFVPGDHPTYMSACDGWYGGRTMRRRRG